MTAESPQPRVWLLLGIGAAAGLFSGFLGVGGGIVMVPLMIGLLGFDRHRAHATSLGAIVLISISATLRFGVAGEVDWVIGLTLGAGGVFGATAGAHLMNRLSAEALQGIFGVILVVAGLRMTLGEVPGVGGAPEAWVAVALAAVIGFVAGMAAGLAGIGGGVIMVPAMVFLLGMSQHAAEGTSLLAILLAALAATRVNIRNGRIDLRHAAVIGAGGVILAQVGASAALAVPAGSLGRLFGAFLVLAGLRMLWGLRR